MGAAPELLDQLRPLTVEEFHRLVEAGVLGPEERVELIDGVIVRMNPLNPPHASISSRLMRALSRLHKETEALVREGKAVVLGRHGELYPDISVVRFREDDYVAAHPTAAQTLLVVEVSDSTLESDRRIKVPQYARARIPETWIANIPDRQIEVFREPRRGSYRLATTVPAIPRSVLAPHAWPGLQIDVEELFRWL